MVSIIILTYNSANYIERLIKSILAFNKCSDYEIIAVDNNSEDETIRVVQNSKLKVKNYSSKFKVIENKENFGFAKGINIGVKEARGEYVLFINPDCEWNNGSIDDLASIFEQDEDIGVVGGKILNREGKSEKSAGKFLRALEIMVMTVGLDEFLGVRFSPGKLAQVDFVSGGFMIVRRDLFEKLGGFDENLFMYIEDMEFCFRVKKKGLKVLFDPEVSIIHESHGSSSRGFAIENIYKGLLYFQKKHGSGLSYQTVKSMLMAKAVLLVLIGKIINNKYLSNTYSKLLKI